MLQCPACQGALLWNIKGRAGKGSAEAVVLEGAAIDAFPVAETTLE
jgi:hypothetical protein